MTDLAAVDLIDGLKEYHLQHPIHARPINPERLGNGSGD
jgi:hypothetical protein